MHRPKLLLEWLSVPHQKCKFSKRQGKDCTYTYERRRGYRFHVSPLICLCPQILTHLFVRANLVFTHKHQRELQFRLPGNGKIRLKLVIFSLQRVCWLKPFNSTHTAQRIATQITHSSIGCHILVLLSIGADSQEWNEHQTLFHHSHLLLPSDRLLSPYLYILSISIAFTDASCPLRSLALCRALLLLWLLSRSLPALHFRKDLCK